jgi:hypothetical protein
VKALYQENHVEVKPLAYTYKTVGDRLIKADKQIKLPNWGIEQLTR